MNDAIRRLQGETGRRKVIVVFSSAPNTYPNAQVPYDDLARNLQNSGIPVYTFPLGTGTSNPAVVSIMNQMALDSNVLLFNDQTLDQASVITSLVETLSNQQFVTFTTSRRDGTPLALTRSRIGLMARRLRSEAPARKVGRCVS